MQSIFLDGQGDAVVVVVRSDGIGGCEDLRRGVAHGYAQTGILDHRKIVAGIAYGHDLVTAQTQLFGQGQQAAALGNAGGVQFDVAAQAGGGLYVGAGGQHGAPGLVPQLHFGVHDAEFFHLADLLLQDGAQVREMCIRDSLFERGKCIMQIFNTMSRQKEEFVPQTPGEYRIYVCGPTVYNYIHIGNARPMIVFDTLRRYLEYCGNKVYYVSNITDIDDKLIKKGQEEGTSMQEVARKFEAEYIKDSDGLNVKAPTVRPRATEHIGEIIHIVKDLVDSGHAYVARNGDVYFRVKSDPGYGKLSHLNLDDLESGNRALRSQMDDDLKEDSADFAVWKAAKPGEPYWESPGSR